MRILSISERMQRIASSWVSSSLKPSINWLNPGTITIAHTGLEEFGFGVRASTFCVDRVTFLGGDIEIGFNLARIERARTDRLNQLVTLRQSLGEILLKGGWVGALRLWDRGHAPLIFLREDIEELGI